MGVGNAAAMIGMKPRVAYTWITRWLSKGYEGLLPKKRTGRPSKLSTAQKEKLKELLKKKEYWTIREVEAIIKKEFSVEYKRSRLYDLLRELGLKLSKPYILDVKRPDNAEEILAERLEAVLQSLKAAGHGIKDFVIGFFDESSPQLSPNTARLWSFKKLKKHLVFLPTYSPDLNPIEYVWKSLRKRISEVFMESVEELKRFIKVEIPKLFKNRGYAKGWIETFSFLFQKIFNPNFCNFLAE
jgi:Transposase and inactivated derivatives